MYLIIAGAGIIGGSLAGSLVAAGHEVLIIDTDPARVAKVQQDLGNVAIAGYPASVRVLTEAGASRASVLIAVTGRDEDNLAVCLLAKYVMKVPRTVALANQPDNAPLFESAGIDIAVSSVDLVLAALAGSLPAHPLLRLMPVSSRTKEVVAIKVPARAAIAGRSVSEVPLPYGALIALVVTSDGRVQTASPHTLIQDEDEVIAVVPPDAAEALWETLTEQK